MHQPLETVSVVDAATNRLRDSLFAGAFASGQEIKDTQLANDYGIARPTARIAIQQLINEGMLERPPGFSARVRVFDPAQIRDIYRVRRLIELDAIREIQRDPEHLSAVKEALEGFASLAGQEDWVKIAEADVRFHASVVNSSNSPRLMNYFAGISSEMRLVIALLRKQYRDTRDLYKEHAQLFEMLAGNASQEALEVAWLAHLDTAQEYLEQHLKEKVS